MKLWKEFMPAASVGAAATAGLSAIKAVQETVGQYPEYFLRADNIQEGIFVMAVRTAMNSIDMGVHSVPGLLVVAGTLGGLGALSKNNKNSLKSAARYITGLAAGSGAAAAVAFGGVVGTGLAIQAIDEKNNEPAQQIRRVPANDLSTIASISMPPPLCAPV